MILFFKNLLNKRIKYSYLKLKLYNIYLNIISNNNDVKKEIKNHDFNV
jgi:hypothetical protein